jgi:two-component system chemotaxis sensor kinase CheA
MRIMGEMVVHRARLDEALARVSDRLPSSESRKLHEVTHGFTRDLRHLRDGLMRVRMVPIGEIFERLPFVVRDLSREIGKKPRINVAGQSTELDKYLVERLKDPLLHLVRNAVCHGIEPSAERLAKGKSAEGTITLRAATAGETVLIDVADDGRGIDVNEVAARARANGLEVSEEPGPSELLDLLCAPGLSTRDEADLGAGRGIGMAAVKSTVLELGGEIELDSTPSHGTTFRLRLPLTLAVADALIISAGGQRFALPQGAVQEITTAAEDSINKIEKNEILRYRNGVLPLVRLTTLFGLGAEPRKAFPVLVIGTGLNAVGVLADRVLGQRENVVSAVGDTLLKVPGIYGATELGD